MIALTAATRVFIALDPVDMRKSFSGLHGVVQQQLCQDPVSGHVFVFTNRHKTRIKLLYWDGSGLWVAAKRLEKGRFQWPSGEGHCGQIRPEEFHALVNGLDIVGRRDWFRI
jgi:transposase